MKDRITKFLNKENISPAEFADKIGVQRSSVSHVLNGRNYPSASFIQKMLMVYPQLNPRWLLLGEGGMLMTAIPAAPAPSLFDQPVSEEKVVKKTLQSSIKYNEDSLSVRSSDSEIQGVPNKSEDKRSLENNDVNQIKVKTELPLAKDEMVNKDIDKIIILYKDKTFTSYSPS